MIRVLFLYVFYYFNMNDIYVSDKRENKKKETKGLQGFSCCIAIIISNSTDWYDMLDMKSALMLV